MSAAWALSTWDFLAHAVPDPEAGPPGVLLARCGHAMPAAVGLDGTPRATVCRGCALADPPQRDRDGP